MTCLKSRPLLLRAAVVSAAALAVFGVGAAPWRVGAALAQEAASAVQDVTLQDVTLALGEATLTAPRVVASGTRLSKDDLLALLKASAEPLSPRLARLEAASLAIPELRVESRAKGGRQIVTYRDVTARDIRAGRVAELTSSGATIAVEGAHPGAGSYGRFQAADLDLAALAKLYGEPGDGKSVMMRLYGLVSLADVAYRDARGTEVAIARIEGRELAGKQVPATWTGALQAFSGLDLSEQKPAERARLAGLAADLAEAVSVGSLEATGFSVKDAKGEAPMSVSIGRMSQAASGSSLEDVAFSGGGAGGTIARLSLSGFSLAPTIAALRKLSAGKSEPSDDDLRRLTPTIGALALKGLSLTLAAEEPAAAKRGAARDPLAAPIRVALRDGAMTFATPSDGVPSNMRATLSGLTLPSSAVSGVPGLGSLGAYGYRDLDLDVAAETAWSEGAKEFVVRELSVSGKEMGAVRLNATLGGIGPEVFDRDPGVSGFAMLGATAKALDLKIENAGLFERFIAAQSKSLSLKPEELTQEYVTASVVGVPAILGGSAGAKAIGAAMGQFVAKPGTLALSAKAKNPSGIGMIEFSASPTPAAVLDRLDVSATAK